MKTAYLPRWCATCLSAFLTTTCFSEEGAGPGPSAVRSIPLEHLGAEADKQGGAGFIMPTEAGAELHAVMQDLKAEATRDGLWLSSTSGDDAGGPDLFRVRAMALGREGAGSTMFSENGTVRVMPDMAAWVRPGVTEEYRVSADGVRQDFLIHRRCEGTGREMRLELSLTGARAEEASYGARLVVAGSGRELAYHRLKVTDANGRELEARMEVTNPGQVTLVVADDGAAYPVRIDPTFSDADWLSVGGLLGASHPLRAMATDGAGNLYVGGTFTEIGEVAANRVARWNGSDWSVMGSGMNNPVDVLLWHGGSLYAGGAFSVAGGVQVNQIARWTGSAWSALGSGTDGQVLSLASDGGNLYAGGVFTTAGGVTVNGVAKWDGSTWSALDTGVSGGGFPIVYALTVFDGNLYAGGTFTSAGAVSASRIARWNGSAWSAVGGGVSGTVRALSASTTDLYVGGDFTQAGGAGASRLAKWDGTGWSALGSGMNNSVNALIALPGGQLYAGGAFTTAGGVAVNRVSYWDGGAWSAFELGVGGTVRALALSGSTLFAGGDFTNAGDLTANYVAAWDGTQWIALSRALNGQVTALVLAGGDLVAGGSFTRAGGLAAGGVARWDGSIWTPLGSGVNGTVRALASDGVQIYAGGEFTVAGSGPAHRVARWDGVSWSPLGDGVTATVNALALSGGSLYVGGNFNSAGGVPANHIARWSGGEWSALDSGLEDGFTGITTVHALATNGSILYAGGSFTKAGGAPASGIAMWNGVAWSPLGSGMNNEVYALAVKGSELYAGGLFSMADGASASRVARWNGIGWFPLGSGVGGSGSSFVSALAVAGDVLYAGGSFTTAGGAPASNIARWGGRDWSALGSGTNAGVHALVANGTVVHAGGPFSQAGGKFRHFIARAEVGSGEPDILVSGNGTDIVNGDVSPDAADDTQFGITAVEGGSVDHTFTIMNDGTADLILTGTAPNYVTLSGSTAFSVISQPADDFVPIGGSVTFTIRFDPEATGVQNALVTIANNDGDKSPFAFAISGAGQTLVTSTFSNAAAVSLPAGEPDTTSGPASPYPGTIAVSGVSGEIVKVVVKLNGLAHTYPADLDVLLVGPTGINCLLMSDVGGGNGITDVDLVFDSSAASSLNGSEIISGTYKPSNIDINDTFDAPAPAGPYGSSLAAYNTPAAVNGPWSLYIVDSAEGDSGNLTGGWEICVTYAPAPEPEIAVSGNGIDITSGDVTPGTGDHTDYGIVAFNGGTVARTFTISNTGTAALNLTGTPRVAVSGVHASEFTVTQLPDASVDAGSSTTFRVTFDPADAGLRSATLSIVNNDPNEDPFQFSIQGTGQTAQEIFDAAMLAAGLSGINAAANATPFNDGVANLLKQAFNMNLAAPDVRVQSPGGPPGGLPAIDFSPGGGGPVFRFEFVRRVRSGLVYTPQKNSSLNPLTWTPLTDTPTVTPIDGEWERVIYEEPVDPMTTPQCFGRVNVTLP